MDEVLGMSYLDPTTHASLAFEDSMRHLPEFKPTTKRVDWLLSVLASAREARSLGMTSAECMILASTPGDEQDLEDLEEDLARLGYRLRWVGPGKPRLVIGWCE